MKTNPEQTEMYTQDTPHPSILSAHRCTKKIRVKFLLHGCRIITGRSQKHCCSPINTAQQIPSAPGMLGLWLCSCQHSWSQCHYTDSQEFQQGQNFAQNLSVSFVQKVPNHVTKLTLNYIYEHFSTFQMNSAQQKASLTPVQRLQ